MTELDETEKPRMKGTADASKIKTVDFLRLVWPSKGHYCIAERRKHWDGEGSYWKHSSFDDIETAAKYALEHGSSSNVYFACLSMREPFIIDKAKLKKQQERGDRNPTGKTWRTHKNMLASRCFFLDLDVGKDYSDQSAAIRSLKSFIDKLKLPRPMLVSSGRGVHVYWPLTEDVDADEWKVQAQKLKRLCDHHDFHADPTRIADLASVLRVPGTFHLKDPTNPLPVRVLAIGSPASSFETFVGVLDRSTKLLPTSEPLKAPVYTLDPPPADEMAAMLRELASKGCFSDRNGIVSNADDRIVRVGWMECGAALKLAYGDEPGQALWALTHEDDRARADAPDQWPSFASEPAPGQVTIGTIIKAAKDAGIVPIDPASYPGDAGDIANARRFAGMHRDKLLYVPEMDEWLRFDPVAGWTVAPFGEVDRAAKEVVAAMEEDLIQIQRTAGSADPQVKAIRRHIERTARLRGLRDMIELAKSERGMSISAADFDADPLLLGVTNGVLDLRTGSLRPVAANVRVSRRCRVSFDPTTPCPKFERALARVIPDAEVRGFLQRWAGYCLTGRTDQQVFVFLHGGGKNGKSTIVETLAFVLGDYSLKVQTEVLTEHQRNPAAASPDIVALKGMRFVYTGETEEGQRVAASRLKEWTGGDTLTGRVPYAKTNISFRPTFKLTINGNHKLVISDDSEGMWRRMKLVLFEVEIPENKRDFDLLEKLKAEGSGVLNWMIAGLKELQTKGLCAPDVVRAATDSYRSDEDVLGAFLVEECERGENLSTRKDYFRMRYDSWCRVNGHRAMSQARLTRRLVTKRIKLAPDKRTIFGIEFKSPRSNALS